MSERNPSPPAVVCADGGAEATAFGMLIEMPELGSLDGDLHAGLRARFDQLIAAGKPAKVALVAIMRKLIVLANVPL